MMQNVNIKIYILIILLLRIANILTFSWRYFVERELSASNAPYDSTNCVSSTHGYNGQNSLSSIHPSQIKRNLDFDRDQ